MCVSCSQFARKFYIGEWYSDCSVEVDRMTKQAQKAKSDKKRSAADVTREFDKLKDLQQVSEKRKSFLLSQVGIKISGLALLRFDPTSCYMTTSCSRL